MELQQNWVIIGCDFFRKLCEESTKDESLPKIHFASADEPLTHAKITLPIKLRSGMITNNNEEIAQSSKPSSGMEQNNNKVGSDDDSEATLTDYNSDSE